MSCFPLAIIFVVTLGLQHVSSQPTNQRRLIHCTLEHTSHQCAPGPGRRIINSASVWDPTYEQDVGEDESWNCTPCCQLSGRTIPQCHENREKRGTEKENQLEESMIGKDHCQMIHTAHQCIPGPGKRIVNSGTVWDPSQEQYVGEDETWNCRACCQFPEKTIPQCEASKENTTNAENTGEIGDIDGEQTPSTTVLPTVSLKNIEQESSHCQQKDVTFKCSPGPGRRIINGCEEWDPACEEDAGEDPTWNCLPCCLENGKSIRSCDENMNILK